MMQEQVIEEQVEVGTRRVAVSPPQYYTSYEGPLRATYDGRATAEYGGARRLSTELVQTWAASPPPVAAAAYSQASRSVGVGLALERHNEVRSPRPARPALPTCTRGFVRRSWRAGFLPAMSRHPARLPPVWFVSSTALWDVHARAWRELPVCLRC